MVILRRRHSRSQACDACCHVLHERVSDGDSKCVQPCGHKLCTETLKHECRVTATKPCCFKCRCAPCMSDWDGVCKPQGWPHSLAYPVRNAKMYAPCQGSNQTVQNDSFWSAMLLRYAVTPLALHCGVTTPVDCMHAKGWVSPLLLFVAVLICRCCNVPMQACVGNWCAESYCSSWHSCKSCMMQQSAEKQPTQ